GRNSVERPEDERDRAVLLIRLARPGDRAARSMLPALEAAIQRDPDDVAAAESRGYALMLLNRSAEALAAFETVLTKSPNQELTLVGAASMAEALGQTETAIEYWRRAIAVNSWVPEYHHHFALLLVKKAS